MYLTVRGLVLRVTAYKEWDAILTLLTADYGKLTVKARGLRRKNSTLTAPCQLLSLGEFTLFAYKGMHTINEAHSVELFMGLRKDLLKLSLGTYFAQVAEVVSQEDTQNPELLSLVLNSLYALAKLDMPQLKVKAAFEFRCACLAGYTPDLQNCHICGSGVPDRLDITNGVALCGRCRGLAGDGLRMPISAGTLDALRYLSFCPAKHLLSFDASEETLEQLSQVSEAYLSAQLERGFSTLDFYKTLLLN